MQFTNRMHKQIKSTQDGIFLHPVNKTQVSDQNSLTKLNPQKNNIRKKPKEATIKKLNIVQIENKQFHQIFESNT